MIVSVRHHKYHGVHSRHPSRNLAFRTTAGPYLLSLLNRAIDTIREDRRGRTRMSFEKQRSTLIEVYRLLASRLHSRRDYDGFS